MEHFGWLPWSAETAFSLGNIILISWIALIFKPFARFSQYVIPIPVLILCSSYVALIYQMVFHPKPDGAALNFFTLESWLALSRDPFYVTGITTHFCVADLMIGRWMVNDFYANHANGYSPTGRITKGRFTFSLVLVLTYMMGPAGLLVYYILRQTFWRQYEMDTPIDVFNPDKGNKRAQFKTYTELLDDRPIRLSDTFPQPVRKVYHLIIGTIGLAVLILSIIPFTALVVFCCWKYRSRSVFYLLQLQTFIDTALYGNKFASLFVQLQRFWSRSHVPNAKGEFESNGNKDFFVFGDGIGVSSHEKVVKYLQTIPPRKTDQSLGWTISSSQREFSKWLSIILSSDDDHLKFGRQIVKDWLHGFDRISNIDQNALISKIVPRTINPSQIASDDTIYLAMGETMFYLATNLQGEMTQAERAAYLDTVKNPTIFFPNWFNFLLLGNKLERKGYESYNTMRAAIARYPDAKGLQAALQLSTSDEAKQLGFTETEILRLIAIIFGIAGAAAPAKLAVAVVRRLWDQDPEKRQQYGVLFNQNPKNFIRECARLDKIVPMVNIVANSSIQADVKQALNRDIGPDTRIHCSVVSANQDPSVFPKPAEFDPTRTNLLKMFVWNGVEEDIVNSENKPPRYCPGHDFSLDVIEFVATQFRPHVTETVNREEEKPMTDQAELVQEFDKSRTINMSMERYNNSWDGYTKVLYKLMLQAVLKWNGLPPRGTDIRPPLNLPGKFLGEFVPEAAPSEIPAFDEDEPDGVPLPRRIARFTVNVKLWSMDDIFNTFDSRQDAVAYRYNLFGDLPTPNVVYDEMTSDKAMTQLAFSGMASHRTQRVTRQQMDEQHIIPEGHNLIHEVAKYVNDVTGLYTFAVRPGFERYGAAAYFDGDRKIVGIYWSHAKSMIYPKSPNWEHAKYVWKTTFFAVVTISEHLLSTHMIESNALTLSSRRSLSPNHPLRCFLKPFTYHAISINTQAITSLMSDRGLVHRVWAFDYKEFLKVCKYLTLNYQFKLLPEYIPSDMHWTEDWNDEQKKPKDQPKLSREEWDHIYPIDQDLNQYWEIIREYVEDFFKFNYPVDPDDPSGDKLPSDSEMEAFVQDLCQHLGIPGITSRKRLIDVLTHLISVVTGWHEHVGQISDYMLDPTFIGAKLEKNKEMLSVQNYTQLLVLTVLTGLKMPGILEDWSHLIPIGSGYTANLNNYKRFKENLKNLSVDVDERNKKRPYPFQSFNPRNIETSVSI